MNFAVGDYPSSSEPDTGTPQPSQQGHLQQRSAQVTLSLPPPRSTAAPSIPLYQAPPPSTHPFVPIPVSPYSSFPQHQSPTPYQLRETQTGPQQKVSLIIQANDRYWIAPHSPAEQEIRGLIDKLWITPLTPLQQNREPSITGHLLFHLLHHLNYPSVELGGSLVKRLYHHQQPLEGSIDVDLTLQIQNSHPHFFIEQLQATLVPLLQDYFKHFHIPSVCSQERSPNQISYFLSPPKMGSNYCVLTLKFPETLPGFPNPITDIGITIVHQKPGHDSRRFVLTKDSCHIHLGPYIGWLNQGKSRSGTPLPSFQIDSLAKQSSLQDALTCLATHSWQTENPRELKGASPLLRLLRLAYRQGDSRHHWEIIKNKEGKEENCWDLIRELAYVWLRDIASQVNRPGEDGIPKAFSTKTNHFLNHFFQNHCHSHEEELSLLFSLTVAFQDAKLPLDSQDQKQARNAVEQVLLIRLGDHLQKLTQPREEDLQKKALLWGEVARIWALSRVPYQETGGILRPIGALPPTQQGLSSPGLLKCLLPQQDSLFEEPHRFLTLLQKHPESAIDDIIKSLSKTVGSKPPLEEKSPHISWRFKRLLGHLNTLTSQLLTFFTPQEDSKRELSKYPSLEDLKPMHTQWLERTLQQWKKMPQGDEKALIAYTLLQAIASLPSELQEAWASFIHELAEVILELSPQTKKPFLTWDLAVFNCLLEATSSEKKSSLLLALELCPDHPLQQTHIYYVLEKRLEGENPSSFSPEVKEWLEKQNQEALKGALHQLWETTPNPLRLLNQLQPYFGSQPFPLFQAWLEISCQKTSNLRLSPFELLQFFLKCPESLQKATSPYLDPLTLLCLKNKETYTTNQEELRSLIDFLKAYAPQKPSTNYVTFILDLLKNLGEDVPLDSLTWVLEQTFHHNQLHDFTPLAFSPYRALHPQKLVLSIEFYCQKDEGKWGFFTHFLERLIQEDEKKEDSSSNLLQAITLQTSVLEKCLSINPPTSFLAQLFLANPSAILDLEPTSPKPKSKSSAKRNKHSKKNRRSKSIPSPQTPTTFCLSLIHWLAQDPAGQPYQKKILNHDASRLLIKAALSHLPLAKKESLLQEIVSVIEGLEPAEDRSLCAYHLLSDLSQETEETKKAAQPSLNRLVQCCQEKVESEANEPHKLRKFVDLLTQYTSATVDKESILFIIKLLQKLGKSTPQDEEWVFTHSLKLDGEIPEEIKQWLSQNQQKWLQFISQYAGNQESSFQTYAEKWGDNILLRLLQQRTDIQGIKPILEALLKKASEEADLESLEATLLEILQPKESKEDQTQEARELTSQLQIVLRCSLTSQTPTLLPAQIFLRTPQVLLNLKPEHRAAFFAWLIELPTEDPHSQNYREQILSHEKAPQLIRDALLQLPHKKSKKWKQLWNLSMEIIPEQLKRALQDPAFTGQLVAQSLQPSHSTPEFLTSLTPYLEQQIFPEFQENESELFLQTCFQAFSKSKQHYQAFSSWLVENDASTLSSWLPQWLQILETSSISLDGNTYAIFYRKLVTSFEKNQISSTHFFSLTRSLKPHLSSLRGASQKHYFKTLDTLSQVLFQQKGDPQALAELERLFTHHSQALSYDSGIQIARFFLEAHLNAPRMTVSEAFFNGIYALLLSREAQNVRSLETARQDQWIASIYLSLSQKEEHRRLANQIFEDLTYSTLGRKDTTESVNQRSNWMEKAIHYHAAPLQPSTMLPSWVDLKNESKGSESPQIAASTSSSSKFLSPQTTKSPLISEKLSLSEEPLASLIRMRAFLPPPLSPELIHTISLLLPQLMDNASSLTDMVEARILPLISQIFEQPYDDNPQWRFSCRQLVSIAIPRWINLSIATPVHPDTKQILSFDLTRFAYSRPQSGAPRPPEVIWEMVLKLINSDASSMIDISEQLIRNYSRDLEQWLSELDSQHYSEEMDKLEHLVDKIIQKANNPDLIAQWMTLFYNFALMRVSSSEAPLKFQEIVSRFILSSLSYTHEADSFSSFVDYYSKVCFENPNSLNSPRWLELGRELIKRGLEWRNSLSNYEKFSSLIYALISPRLDFSSEEFSIFENTFKQALDLKQLDLSDCFIFLGILDLDTLCENHQYREVIVNILKFLLIYIENQSSPESINGNQQQKEIIQRHLQDLIRFLDLPPISSSFQETLFSGFSSMMSAIGLIQLSPSRSTDSFTDTTVVQQELYSSRSRVTHELFQLGLLGIRPATLYWQTFSNTTSRLAYLEQTMDTLIRLEVDAFNQYTRGTDVLNPPSQPSYLRNFSHLPFPVFVIELYQMSPAEKNGLLYYFHSVAQLDDEEFSFFIQQASNPKEVEFLQHIRHITSSFKGNDEAPSYKQSKSLAPNEFILRHIKSLGSIRHINNSFFESLIPFWIHFLGRLTSPSSTQSSGWNCMEELLSRSCSQAKSSADIIRCLTKIKFLAFQSPFEQQQRILLNTLRKLVSFDQDSNPSASWLKNPEQKLIEVLFLFQMFASRNRCDFRELHLVILKALSQNFSPKILVSYLEIHSKYGRSTSPLWLECLCQGNWLLDASIQHFLQTLLHKIFEALLPNSFMLYPALMVTARLQVFLLGNIQLFESHPETMKPLFNITERLRDKISKIPFPHDDEYELTPGHIDNLKICQKKIARLEIPWKTLRARL